VAFQLIDERLFVSDRTDYAYMYEPDVSPAVESVPPAEPTAEPTAEPEPPAAEPPALEPEAEPAAPIELVLEAADDLAGRGGQLDADVDAVVVRAPAQLSPHGIPRDVLLAGQFVAGGLKFNPEDDLSVRIGMDLWKRYGGNITKGKLRSAVRRAMPEYRRLQVRNDRRVVLTRLQVTGQGL
jgi:hypothetical protein